MAANKLVINDDKTHLLVLGTKSMSDKRNLVTLQAGNHTITPTHKERLLGCVVSDNMKWRQHVLEDDQSMIRQLTSRHEDKADGGKWHSHVQGLLPHRAVGWL